MLSACERTDVDKVELLKVIAHPVRIKLLEELTQGVKCVGDLEDFLEVSQPNVSQHLTLLRRCGVIDYYVDGADISRDYLSLGNALLVCATETRTPEDIAIYARALADVMQNAAAA